jgi:hypothetical protein
MEKFAGIEMKLAKNVKKGTSENLLSLFSFKDRITPMDVLLDIDEPGMVTVEVVGFGEVDLALGNDMEKGMNKTIMTLFWHDQKSKDFKMEKDGAAGEKVLVNLWKKD